MATVPEIVFDIMTHPSYELTFPRYDRESFEKLFYKPENPDVIYTNMQYRRLLSSWWMHLRDPSRYARDLHEEAEVFHYE